MNLLVIVGIIGGVAGLVWLAWKIEYGLYLLAATAFLSGWHITFGGETLREVFSLPIFNVFAAGPLVDFLAIVVCVAVVLSIVIGRVRFSAAAGQALAAPTVYYGLFLVSAAASAWLVYHGHPLLSFKYVVRPQLFAYICFFVVPVVLVQRREALRCVLWIWFWSGVAIAVYGLSSLIVANDLYRWVTPYPIAGFAPLGTNHNQIAEVLVAIIPLSLALWLSRRKEARGRWLLAGIALMALAAFLTLSRALWLVMGAQVLALAWWYRAALKSFVRMVDRRVWYGLGLLVAGVMAYMGVYLLSAVPSSSNTSRGIMNMIVVSSVWHHPLFGTGPGTFITVMRESPDYIRSFSVELDAHGMIQKIVLEQGIVGVIAWLLYLAAVLGYIYETTATLRSKDQLLVARLLLVTAAGVIGFQLFNTSYYVATMWLPLAMCFAGALLLRQKKW